MARLKRAEVRVNDLSYPPCTLQDMWKRWYHVLVEAPDGKRHLIAIEATSAREAKQLVGADWGEDSIREVTSPR